MKYLVQCIGLGLCLFVFSACSAMPGVGTNALAAADAQLTVEAAGLSVDSIHRAITLSEGGQVDVALNLLLNGTETDDTQVTPPQPLGLSEGDFLALSDADQMTMSDDIQRVGRAARALTEAGLTRVSEAVATGDQGSATQWTSRIEAMGLWLSCDAHTQLMGMMGTAIIKQVEKSAVGL